MSSEKSRRGLTPIDWKSRWRRVRELRGFDVTQEALADRLGVTQGYLSIIERGKCDVGAKVLLAISREFGKSIEWLLTGKP